MLALQIRFFLKVVSWTEWFEIRLVKIFTAIKNGSRLDGSAHSTYQVATGKH